MAGSVPLYTANSPIPVDLFGSKKYPGLTNGEIGFADSSGNLIYRVNHQSSSKSSPRKGVIVDSAGNPLISVYRQDKGLWEGFKGGVGDEDPIFRVKRTMKTLTRTEFEVVFLPGDNPEDSPSHVAVKGCPFQKSCTIYSGDSIMAQTSLMYKLRQIYAVKRTELFGIPGVTYSLTQAPPVLEEMTRSHLRSHLSLPPYDLMDKVVKEFITVTVITANYEENLVSKKLHVVFKGVDGITDMNMAGGA